MWTELPQTLCVQDPQQLQRCQEEEAVQHLSARRHLVCGSSSKHRVQPHTSGGGTVVLTRFLFSRFDQETLPVVLPALQLSDA